MQNVGQRVGIDCLSTFGLPPVESVQLAADLGCAGLSLALGPWPFNPLGYPPFSLRSDDALRRDTAAALAERGMRLTLGEVFMMSRDLDWGVVAGDLDIFAGLGAERVVTISMDPDLEWSFDQFARLTELATARGLETVVELVPGMTIGSLATATAAVRHVGQPGFGLLLDLMHVGRSGGTPADLAALDPQDVRYVQLCDAPTVPAYPDYAEEVTKERSIPGEGDLPLAEMLRALPRDVFVGIEVPQASQAERGIGPEGWLRPCVAAAEQLLAAL